MNGSLLVADQDMADAMLRMQRVVYREHGAAGITEDGIYAQFDQRIEQGLRTRDGNAIHPGSCGGGQRGRKGEIAHEGIVRGKFQKRHLIFCTNALLSE
jgi:hypothetical protein